MKKYDTVKLHLVNSLMTKKVIELHASGYIADFMLSDNNKFLCLQDNNSYPLEDISISNIGQCYDKFTRSFKFIHTIDTCCGPKGLLLSDTACHLYQSQYVTEKLQAQKFAGEA